MAKKFMADNGIKYQEFDIVQDKTAREEMKNKCNSWTVPTICVDSEVEMGFNKGELREKLGL